MVETERGARYTIAEVERDTGLGKDTLRVWERRYGFPAPSRDALGERLYDAATVERLRWICRAMLAGHRPGRLVGLPTAQLQALVQGEPRPVGRTRRTAEDPSNAAATEADAPGAPAPTHLAVTQALQALRDQDVDALRQGLQAALSALGRVTFTLQVVVPLTRRVGQAWQQGLLAVHQEHLCSEVLQNLLRRALAEAPDPPPDAPRVLLSTLPGEAHGLGLLMAEVMLTQAGARCVSLGVQTPVDSLVAAAQAHQADIVALSASGVMPPGRLREQALALRAALPPSVALWLGGGGARSRRGGPPAAWTVVDDLQDVATALQAWRRRPAEAA